MIFGVLIRAVLELCRRRGMRVPDLDRIRRRKPRLVTFLQRRRRDEEDDTRG
jgi:hypothetical protein